MPHSFNVFLSPHFLISRRILIVVGINIVGNIVCCESSFYCLKKVIIWEVPVIFCFANVRVVSVKDPQSDICVHFFSLYIYACLCLRIFCIFSKGNRLYNKYSRCFNLTMLNVC